MAIKNDNPLKTFPEENLQESPEYWLNKIDMSVNYLLEQAKKKIEDEKKQKNLYYSYEAHSKTKSRAIKIKSAHDYKIFEFAPKIILENGDVMLKALDKSLISYHSIGESLKDKKSFVLDYLNLRYSYYWALSKEILADTEVFKICLKKDADTYISIRFSRELTNQYVTKENSLEFLDINPVVYKNFPDIHRFDLDIAKKAVELNFKNLEHMPKKISSKILVDSDFCKKIMEFNVDYLPKLNNKFRSDEEFLIPVIQKKNQLIEFVSPKLKNKKSFVEHAVGAYNLLEYISDELKSDPELMGKHLKNNIFDAPRLEKYQDVKPLIFNVIKAQHYSYQYLDEKFKEDEDIIYALLHHDGFYTKEVDYSKNYFGTYEKKSIIHLLPSDIHNQLIDEYMEYHYKNNGNTPVSNLDEEVLGHARKKYSDIYYAKTLNPQSEKKKLKL